MIVIGYLGILWILGFVWEVLMLECVVKSVGLLATFSWI